LGYQSAAIADKQFIDRGKETAPYARAAIPDRKGMRINLHAGLLSSKVSGRTTLAIRLVSVRWYIVCQMTKIG